MTLFVDTSVWSLAFRHDLRERTPHVAALFEGLNAGAVVSTGLVLQELLQGFNGPRDRVNVIEKLSSVPLIEAERSDYIAAADLRMACRRRGVQIDTIDALLGQLCIRHGLLMLSADNDFRHMARHTPLKLWAA